MKNGQALKTYTLTLVSAVVNNDLESLEIKDYSIEFDKDVTSYTIIVEKDVEEVTVKAKAVESSAKVTIEGGKDLQPGSNQVIVTVTGTDKTTKTYTINVIKKSDEVTPEVEPKASARLGKLEIKDYEIIFFILEILIFIGIIVLIICGVKGWIYLL